MTEREREFAALGLGYAEGIDQASVVEIPTTGREARKNKRGKWEVQPWNDNYWKEFDDLLDAVRFATPPKLRGYTTYGSVREGCGHLHRTRESAEECLAKDSAGCKSQGGYSDRAVAVVGRNGCLYVDESCTDWIPGPGGRTSGAARF